MDLGKDSGMDYERTPGRTEKKLREKFEKQLGE